MTQVTIKLGIACVVAVTLLIPIFHASQSGAFVNAASPLVMAVQPPSDLIAKPAEALYLQLRSVGLDPEHTFHIREGSLDRAALHVTFEDGEISFTTAINGHITGAFFEGDGEVLLRPPTRVERSSMALFTGTAILEERFTTVYLRFNDETFEELQPYLRESQIAKEFSSRWNETAHNLAEADALRLLSTFSQSLPVASTGTVSPPPADSPPDRMLHIRLQGQQVGTFDIVFDSLAGEQIWAGQAKMVDGVTYYDLWTSFALSGLGRERLLGSQPTDTEIVVSRYKIRTEVKPPTTVNADARVEIDVRKGGARCLFFELSRFLQVKQVEADGRPIEFINNPALDGTQLSKRGNDLVAVVFPDPVRTGQKLELHFVYGGDVLSEAGGGLLYVGARGTWYPNRGNVRANFDLEFHYPPEWTLVATGKRIESEAPVPGEQVTRWVTEQPATLAGFNLGRYERAVARSGVVSVETYAAKSVEKAFPRPPEQIIAVPDIRIPPKEHTIVQSPLLPSPARNAQAVADKAARAVEFFSQHFGPFPYSSLELTQIPGPLSQGWPGLVFLSSFAFLTPTEEADLHLDPLQTAFRRLVLPHETAHQWWGDLIGWRTYRDQWIVEALSNYSALMFLETENPEEFNKILEGYRADLLQKNKEDEFLRDAGPVTLGLRLNSSHFPSGYEAISYGRGTWLFHMLRHMLLDAEVKRRPKGTGDLSLSDEPFVQGLRKVRERYAGKDITTADLLAVFEEQLPPSLRYESRKSLDWFLEGWVQGTALPRFSLQGVKYVPKNGATFVSGTIVQHDAPVDLVTAVPVYAVFGSKQILLSQVFVDSKETSFHLTAPAGTKRLAVDPYRTLLTRPK
ncbi:MAG TPA: M1 family aminopeptidase [Terriglobales bacterium]